MSTYKPTQPRTLALSGAALPTTYEGDPVLVPTRLWGTETLGRLSEYTVEAKTPDARNFSPSVSANVDLDALVGTEVTVSIEIPGFGTFIAGMPGNTGAGNIGAYTREITGLVDSACIVREEGRSVVYQLVIRPWLHLATRSRDCRLFPGMDVVEISETVLKKYGYSYELRLAGPGLKGGYPKRDVQRQHFETDFGFLQRLWEEWGLWWWYEHSGGFHHLILADTLGAFHRHGPAHETVRYLAPGGKRIDEEHIDAFSVTSTLTTGKVTNVDFDYMSPRMGQQVTPLSESSEIPRNTANAHLDVYQWGDFAQPMAGWRGLNGQSNDGRAEAAHLARVSMEALHCEGLRAKGHGNLRGLVTGQSFTLEGYPQKKANREYVVVSCALKITEVGVEAGAPQAFSCESDFEVLPSNIYFRMPQITRKPRTSGPEYAVVVGPEGHDVWVDAQHRVKLQFPWDRLGRFDQNSSIWVRVAMPWQGSQMGASFIPRIGTEVLVDHINGDPDLPIIVGCPANGANPPAWMLPGNQTVSGMRSQSFDGGAQANHLAFDDTKGELQAQLSSDHGASILSLGFIRRLLGNKGRQDARGTGFELRTDLWGVLRAARGLLVSTEARSNAKNHAKDIGETVARLTQARDLQESMAGLAQQHGAQQHDADQSDVAKAIKDQNDAIRGSGGSDSTDFPEFTAPHLLLASPAGIETTTTGSTHIASDQNLALTTGGHVGIAAGQSFLASIANVFSVFVQKLGIMLVAASGKVHIEAQDDQIELVAKKALELISTTDWIELKAKQGIRLNGGGTELEISPQGLLGFTNGQHHIHAASHSTDGPQAKGSGFPASPQSGPGQLEVLRRYVTGSPVGGSDFKVTDSLGAVHSGTLDANGRGMVSGLAAGAVSVLLGHDPHDPWVIGSYQKPPAWQPVDEQPVAAA
ncbi:type VI secretion system Vgr family protein [Paraburkholderia lycopersici]|uniref:Type VI secretion system secreted protein VgrG n=1 Tax=Paraburkholderia lycopersici TaxID=416944 RepID=A0A1G7DGE5_9BURK|nr:type VI secretion system Vgr family protein [Paraburkholderia lycopersici]SDE50658.1 type VI secretion system secreted protein VgrG [Paraburkholderia lycopersici]